MKIKKNNNRDYSQFLKQDKIRSYYIEQYHLCTKTSHLSAIWVFKRVSFEINK
jgi:hypothetical protein